MSFEEFGQTLRSEREKRNLNIEDIADQLKINARQLRALENGDLSALPHPAYARGFIRSYAKFLGLDNEQIQQGLDDYEAPKEGKSEIRERKPARTESAPLSPPPAPIEKSSRGKLAYVLLTLFVICGAGYYAWDTGLVNEILEKYFPKKEQEVKFQNADTFMAQKDASRSSQESEPSEMTNEEETRTVYPPRETVQAPIQQPPDQLEATIPAKADQKPDPGSSSAEVDAAPEVAEGEPADDNNQQGHKLIITAIEECWIYSRADKSDTRQFSLRKGDTFALPFVNTLELKLGNAGGVRLRYDGKDMAPPGSSGQVRTISFPPKDS